MTMQKQTTSERRRQFAATRGINKQSLYQYLTGRCDMKSAKAMKLETDSGKELTRQMLPQKSFVEIWPDRDELLDMANVCAVDATNHALSARDYLVHASALRKVA